MLDTLDSLDGDTAQPAPVLRIQVQAIRRPVRSQDDGQLQLCVPLVAINGPSYRLKNRLAAVETTIKSATA